MDLDLHFSTDVRLKFQSPVLSKILSWFAVLDQQYRVMFLYGAGLIAYLIQFVESGGWLIAAVILNVFISDQTCKWFFKRPIRRMRPGKFFVPEEERKPEWADLPLKQRRVHTQMAQIYRSYKGYSIRANSSMCSSHASNFLSHALVVSHFFNPMLTLLLPVAFLVGIGRWYVGAHWLSDVVVGWCVGIIAAGLTILLFEQVMETLL